MGPEGLGSGPPPRACNTAQPSSAHLPLPSQSPAYLHQGIGFGKFLHGRMLVRSAARWRARVGRLGCRNTPASPELAGQVVPGQVLEISQGQHSTAIDAPINKYSHGLSTLLEEQLTMRAVSGRGPSLGGMRHAFPACVLGGGFGEKRGEGGGGGGSRRSWAKEGGEPSPPPSNPLQNRGPMVLAVIGSRVRGVTLVRRARPAAGPRSGIGSCIAARRPSSHPAQSRGGRAGWCPPPAPSACPPAAAAGPPPPESRGR